MIPIRLLISATACLLLSCPHGSHAFQQILPRSAVPSVSRTAAEQQRFSFGLSMARMNRGSFRRAPVREALPIMNQEIKQLELRVTAPVAGGKDEILGVMSRQAALDKAREMGGLDLILINGNSDPPVCKIVNYSKYRYMQEKKAKDVKKNSKATEIKEVKMSYKIDVHDYEVRKKNASKFLRQGNRVKCTVMFRGREVQHDNLGFDLLEKLSNDLAEDAMKENKAKREGRNLALILSPRPEVMKAISDGRRAKERALKMKKKNELEARSQQTKAAETEAQDAEAEGDFSEDDYDFDDDEEEEDMEDSLDALLGGNDDMTKELFK